MVPANLVERHDVGDRPLANQRNPVHLGEGVCLLERFERAFPMRLGPAGSGASKLVDSARAARSGSV